MTAHKKYDKKLKEVGVEYFDLMRQESEGTKRFFELSGPLIDTLVGGKILFVDELDARLHPHLVKAICELFNSRELNPNNAQLIFVSHNTNLLSSGLLRRDQVWFAEKNRYGATELFSLVEYKDENEKKVRKDASYEKDYLRGRYGAVPIINDLGVAYGNG
jgi:uncharacterized protein